MLQHEMDDPRRTGVLPVRAHLRPQPRESMDCSRWVWTRNKSGHFWFDETPLEEADSLEIEGEA